MSVMAHIFYIFITLWISTVKSELCPAFSLQTLVTPLRTMGELQILGALVQILGALLQTLGEPPPPLPILEKTQTKSFLIEKKISRLNLMYWD